MSELTNQAMQRPVDRLNAQFGHTHCVFRWHDCWFALPAECVREVLFRPAMVQVPHSGAVLSWLCHVRSEFLPVLNLRTLLPDVPADFPAETQMLVISGSQGAWALLVDRVAGLASLETSMAPEGGVENSWSQAVSGWAVHGDQVVRVLDPESIYRLAERSLEECCPQGSSIGRESGSLGETP